MALQAREAAQSNLGTATTVVSLFTQKTSKANDPSSSADMIETNQKNFNQLVSDLKTQNDSKTSATAQKTTSTQDRSDSKLSNVHAAYASNGPDDKKAA